VNFKFIKKEPFGMVNNMNSPSSLSKRKKLEYLLFLGFCAVFIFITKALLRLHLNIPGHSMFFMIFFLMLANRCVPLKYSATICAILSGLLAIMFGMGKGGPLLILKFIMPAMIIDFFSYLMPSYDQKYWTCMFVAALASSTKFISSFIVDYLLGMDAQLIVYHCLIKSGGAISFGALGSLMVPMVISRLKAYDII
jgi:hypothetical protein